MSMRQFTLLGFVILLAMLPSAPSMADPAGQDIEVTTPSGDKAILHPNGRWDFVDTAKAAAAQEIAKTYPENQGCPPGSRGGWGLGRCIPPGDKDYNRGSLSGKGW
jgi:hypothetical protein